MNTEQDPSEIAVATEPLPPPTTVSPGALIREARQTTGITVDDLATLTKLARTTVEALERDDFTALLEPVYARGYYRKCAKVLNIDEKALIDGYNQRVIPKSPLPPAKLRLASGSDLGSGSSLPVPTALVVAVIAVIACALLWFLRGVGGTPSVPGSTNIQPAAVVIESQANEAAAATPSAQPPAEVGSTATTPAASAPTAPSSADASAAVSTQSPASTAAPAAAPASSESAVAAAAISVSTAPAAGNGDGPLLVTFNGRSWLRIKDADGNILVRNELNAGTVRRFGGKLPLDIFIGDAGAVSIEYQGQPIDLAPHTRDNKTAWLQLPAKGVGQ